MLPQKHASVRYKARPAALLPFRDDTSLVAFRYETAAQAEPPIPIPPKSHLRYQRGAATRAASSVPARSPAPVVVSPPPPSLPPPTGPLPFPPTEEHPALRIDIHDPKRDSGHAPTTSSSQAQTFYEESSEDEDPFPYEEFQSFQKTSTVTDMLVAPLRIRSSSPTSHYSENEGQGHSFGGTNSNSQSSIPLPSPGLSEAKTVSPTSPTTPPPNFPDKASSPSIFFRRQFSFRSPGSSMKSTRRLKKKQAGVEEARNETPAPFPKAAKTTTNSPLTNVAPPRNGDEQSFHDGARPSCSPKLAPAPASAPAPDSDDFAEFVQQISFSKRGSIMLGGKRPSRHAATMSNDGGIAQHEPIKEQRQQRAFPLAPSPIAKSQDDAPAASPIAGGDIPRQSHASGRLTPPPPPPPATTTLHADSPATPRSAQHPPSIRLIPVDVERESQKVRSLYEPSEGLRWEDGGRVSSLGEKLEPTVEVPSDVDENAYGFLVYPASRIN